MMTNTGSKQSATRSGLTLLTAILCLLLTAMVVVFVIWYVAWHKPGAQKKPVEKSRTAQAMQTAQAAGQAAQAVLAQLAAPAAALQQISKRLAQAQTARSNLVALAASAGEMCGAASQAVTDVLGVEWRGILVPQRLSRSATPAADAALAASETPAASALVAADVSQEPILLPVRSMYRAWYRMDDLAAEAAALCDEISATNAVVGGLPIEALGPVAAMFDERIRPFADGAKIDESRNGLEAVRGNLTTVSNLVLVVSKHKAVETEQARRLAEMEKQKQDAEQREVARQEKIKAEIAAVAAAEAEASFRNQLHRHNYADARRLLRTVEFKLTEKESRKAYDVAQQRIVRLEEFRDFLAVHVTGYQHPDGWKIAAADKEGITVLNQGATSKVAWADVGDVRMVQFMRYCLMTDNQTRLLLLREQVRALIAASLYCRKCIPENKYVQDLADKMTEKAAALLPSAKDDIDLILPPVTAKPVEANAAPAS